MLLARILLTVAAAVLVGFGSEFLFQSKVLSVILGVIAAVLAGAGAFLKDLTDAVKNYYEIQAKRRQLEKDESRIVAPTPAEVDKYGVPYSERSGSLGSLLREAQRERLVTKQFVTRSEESKAEDQNE